jgi:hypothetical protein
LHEPPAGAAAFSPSDAALSLEDEDEDEDEDDEDVSSSSLPDERFFGSSYSTGFMRGPQAATKQRKPTIGSASLRILERFTGKLLDGRSRETNFPRDGQNVRYRGRLPDRKHFSASYP